MSSTHANHRPHRANGLSLRAQLLPDSAGTPVSLTIVVRPGTLARSRAVCDGAATAAYDAGGRLLSVEVRGRVKLAELVALAQKEGAPVQRFLREALPPRLVNFL
jgi:hypothetical protein